MLFLDAQKFPLHVGQYRLRLLNRILINIRSVSDCVFDEGERTLIKLYFKINHMCLSGCTHQSLGFM